MVKDLKALLARLNSATKLPSSTPALDASNDNDNAVPGKELISPSKVLFPLDKAIDGEESQPLNESFQSTSTICHLEPSLVIKTVDISKLVWVRATWVKGAQNKIWFSGYILEPSWKQSLLSENEVLVQTFAPTTKTDSKPFTANLKDLRSFNSPMKCKFNLLKSPHMHTKFVLEKWDSKSYVSMASVSFLYCKFVFI